MLFTLKDVVHFIMEHKGKRAYIRNSYSDVANSVIRAAEKGYLLLAESPDGKELRGAAVIVVDYVKKTVIVNNIICIKDGLVILIENGLKLYEGYEICGHRRGKLITFTKDNLWEVARRRRKAQQRCLQG